MEIMTTTNIKYGKLLSVIQSNNGINKVFTAKVSELNKIVSGLESFSIQLSLTKVNKTVKLIESLGFSTEIDNSFGFDFECKIYFKFKY
jgi:hypothetical protein